MLPTDAQKNLLSTTFFGEHCLHGWRGGASASGVENCNGMFWAMATDKAGCAALLISSEGSVWAERTLELVSSSKITDLSQNGLTALCGDGQQTIAAFSDGSGLTLPSCAICSKRLELGTTPLYAVAANSGKVLFAGKDEYLHMEDTDAVRQTKIKAAAALEKQRTARSSSTSVPKPILVRSTSRAAST